jgi:integrase/recombinase XerD
MRKYVCRPLPGDASDPLGLTALLDRYLLWLETHHYASATVAIRRTCLSQFLRWCFERNLTLPHAVTLEILERFQRHLYHYRQRNGQHLSLSSQSHRLTSLRRWFAWLVRERVLTQDPAHDLQLPRDERRLPRHPLSVSEVEAVLAQADLTTSHGLRNRAILELLYSTGLRRDESLGLEFTDIDRERRTLLVRRGKGLKDRFVPIGERALAWLDKYLAEARPLLTRNRET